MYSCLEKLVALGYVEIAEQRRFPSDSPVFRKRFGDAAVDTGSLMYKLMLTGKGNAYVPKAEIPL